jgi:MFS family permease
VVVARLERPPPRFVLPTLYAGEAAAFLGLALLADDFSLAAVVAIASIDGALALTARTLTRAVTAAMLEPEGELRAGNAILNVAFTGGAAVGPAAAGAMVAAFGVQAALLLDAVSFYAIGWILFTSGHLPHAEPEPGNLREQVRAGLSYIRENVTLRRLIGAEASAVVFFSAVVPIEVVYAKESLGTGDTGYGLLLGSWGLGMLAGSLVFAKLRRASLPVLLFCSTLAISAGYLGMALAPTLAVACVASTAGGAGNGVQWVAVVSAVQELTLPTMQARVISVLESLASALPALGFVVGGLIATLYTPRATFAFAGLGVLVILALAVPLLGSRWPVHAATEPGSPSEGDVMVELIPAMPADGRASPTWRS